MISVFCMNDWINFRHLYAFWMVARAGSFTRAAKQMRVAQSAVSSQVAALEEYFEESLLVRTNRSVELTPTGQQLLSYAHTIFAQSRAINTLIKNRQSNISHQEFRVGVVGGASRNFVYRLLDEYVTSRSNVYLSISTGSYGELYELLKRFELDAIISLDLPKKRDLREVSYERLGDSKMCIAGTPELISSIRSKTNPPQLEVFNFRHPFEVDLMKKYVQPLVSGRPILRMSTDDIPLLRFFANGGKGIAVLPKVGVHEDLANGQLDAIELRRCPEVIIYGITMLHAPTALGTPDGSLPIWRHTP